MLTGDPGRFRQIITNLMGNSIKFTEKGHILVTVHLVEEVIDSIEVETESSSKNTLSGFFVADRRQSWKGFRTFGQEGYVHPVPDSINLIVSVEDTGVRIPLEAQSRVFTPFMQVGSSISRTHGGTGIGQEVWDGNLNSSGLFIRNLEKIGHGTLPKVFVMSNSINSSRANITTNVCNLTMISKPLRSSMLAASLQRAMGIGNKGNNPRNGELPGLSLQNLLLMRKNLIVDDNNVDLKVATGALKRYGADVASATRGVHAVDMLTPPHF